MAKIRLSAMQTALSDGPIISGDQYVVAMSNAKYVMVLEEIKNLPDPSFIELPLATRESSTLV